MVVSFLPLLLHASMTCRTDHKMSVAKKKLLSWFCVGVDKFRRSGCLLVALFDAFMY